MACNEYENLTRNENYKIGQIEVFPWLVYVLFGDQALLLHAYSHSEGLPSSYEYPPALLNPSVPISQAVPRPLGGPVIVLRMQSINIIIHYPRQGVGDTPEDLPWPTAPLLHLRRCHL